MSEFPKDFDGLLQLLKSPVSSERNEAAIALAELGDPRAIDPLIQALEDPDSNVTRWVAEALGEFGEPAF